MPNLKKQAANFTNDLNLLDQESGNLSSEEYDSRLNQLYDQYGLNTLLKSYKGVDPLVPDDTESVLKRLHAIRKERIALLNKERFQQGIMPAIGETFNLFGDLAYNGFSDGNDFYLQEANKIRELNLLENLQNNKLYYIEGDGRYRPLGTISVKKGGNLNKQNLFDLELGKFTRNQLEGPGYMNLESEEENLQDAKNISNNLINKLPKKSRDELMKLFISYANQPNFKTNYLDLFI